MEHVSRNDEPVNGLVVALGSNDFWSQVVRCTAKSPGDIWNVFCKAKIGYLDMAVPV